MIFRIAALGMGALAMYYFDPDSGKRRRAMLRNLTKGTARRAGHRAHGVVAEARSAIERRREQRPDQDRRTMQHWPIDPVDIDLS